MKIILSIIIFASSCLLLSCQSKEEAAAPDQTPKTLDNETSLKEDIYFKRYASDIIQDLYEEALTKDKKLLHINNEIEHINEIKADSLKAYHKYVQNNAVYFSSADRYINLLSDSSLKQELRAIFAELEVKQTNRTAKLTEANKEVEQRAMTLNDQLILMKLIVTQPMMNNYQTNELPKAKTLQYMIKKYDSLIDKTKPYTVIKK